MTSVIVRHKRKRKNNAWISTRFALPHRGRVAIQLACSTANLVIGMSRLNAIASVQTHDAFERLAKAAAYAACAMGVVSNHLRHITIMNEAGVSACKS